MATTAHDMRMDTPLYTVAEAARALNLSPSTLSTWTRGYRRQTTGRPPVVGAAVLSTLPSAGGRHAPTIPFVGLAEGMVLAAVRAAGVPLQRVRPALEKLSAELGVEHALASRQLYTDGAELLYEIGDRAGGSTAALGPLIVVRSGQRVFAEVVDRYLRRISYGPDGLASLIQLPGYDLAEVIADPTRSFGQPIFARGGARVADVLGRFWAGEDLTTVSAEFGVPFEELEDAVRVASRRAA